MTELERPSLRVDWRRSGLVLLAAMLAAMWLVQVVDEVLLDDRFEIDGIHPRHLDSLLGIVRAPFLHLGFAHLIANTVPFVVLGALVVAHGRRRWIAVTVTVVLVGGALTWLLARSGNHIGASGVVFGYLGYLVASAFAHRDLRAVVTAVVAVVIYGGLVVGFVPRSGVSWEGHLFGAIAGVVAAAATAPRRGRTPELPLT